MTMKSNVAQAMAKIPILTTDKANSIFVNTLCMIVVGDPCIPICHTFPKSLKLTEKAMVHILDLMDNEWCFSLGFFFLEKQIVQLPESSFLTSCCYVCKKVLHA